MTQSRFLLPCLGVALLGIALVAGGCSDGRPTRVPVSGQVLFNGQPLQTGFVRVMPNEGRVAIGKLDKNGRFILTTYEKGDGCLPGTHSVEIHSADNSKEGFSIPLIPLKYSKKATSGLSVTIDGPTEDLTFSLNSTRPR